MAKSNGDITPAMRSLRTRMAANQSWANTPDRNARTAAARKAALDRFERLVDPDGVMEPGERGKRADSTRRAHFQMMAIKSLEARQRKAASKTPSE